MGHKSQAILVGYNHWSFDDNLLLDHFANISRTRRAGPDSNGVIPNSTFFIKPAPKFSLVAKAGMGKVGWM